MDKKWGYEDRAEGLAADSVCGGTWGCSGGYLNEDCTVSQTRPSRTRRRVRHEAHCARFRSTYLNDDQNEVQTLTPIWEIQDI
jgi:hypothetical protein